MFKSTINTLIRDTNISKLNINNFETSIFALCLFLLTPAFYAWNTISPLLFIGICSLISLKNNKNIKLKNLIFFTLFSIIYIFIGVKNEFNLFGFLSLLGFCTLLLTSEAFLIQVFTKYKFIFSITIIPSIFVFLLIVLFKIDLPHSTIEPLNHYKPYTYIQYPFLVQENTLLQLIFPRFSGYYDEPGVVGTVSGVLLMSSGFNLKKMINIPILIAGLLSFSFAFYIIAFIYGLAFVSFKYKILIAVLIISLSVFLADNEFFNKQIISRVEFKDGKLVGDNRVANPDFDRWFNQYRNSQDYYFGLGNKASLDYNYGGASYKDLIVAYGIIVFLFFCSLFIILAYNQFKFKKEFFIYLFIIFTVLYQRPFITTFYYMFLIFTPLYILPRYIKTPITQHL